MRQLRQRRGSACVFSLKGSIVGTGCILAPPFKGGAFFFGVREQPLALERHALTVFRRSHACTSGRLYLTLRPILVKGGPSFRPRQYSSVLTGIARTTESSAGVICAGGGDCSCSVSLDRGLAGRASLARGLWGLGFVLTGAR
jgi:hypothetical protein